MKKILNHIFTYPKIPDFAQSSFEKLYEESDKIMIILLLLQWFIATFVTSMAYGTYYYGFLSGAFIVLPMLILYKYLKGDSYYRYFMAMAMMLFSVIYIQQYLGRIEMHFHIFIAMAILTLYKDIVPLIVAAATTIVHHLVFNYLQLYEVSLFDMPVMIFNYGCGLDIVTLHGIFVVAELLVLSYIVRVQIEQYIELNGAQESVLKLNKELEHSSLHDTLTLLPNRLYLINTMEQILLEAKQNGSKFAVIFLDLDHFKNVNDTLGHDIGDALLRTIANLLKKSFGESALTSRIGGDEFVLLLKDFQEKEELMPLLNNLLSEFRQELLIKGYTIRVSVSMGISIYPDDTQSISGLMKYADIAMYQSKKDGRDGYNFFTKPLKTQIHTEVDIINDMQRAFYDKEFQLYYQPKIDTQTQKVVGAEALIRWIHPQKGMIGPNEFIPLAESTGFILNIGQFVMNEAVQMIKRLNLLGFDDFKISINVSARQFQNSNLDELIKSALESADISAKNLAIEITESLMMRYIEVSLELLEKLSKLGISIYLDDFGTGYSSLSYLKKFPIDTLKIDKIFIDDIGDDAKKNESLLVNTILAMGKSLNIEVIAEGVEDQNQYKYLKAKGCNTIQGYYFSKPLSEKDFIEFLQK